MKHLITLTILVLLLVIGCGNTNNSTGPILNEGEYYAWIRATGTPISPDLLLFVDSTYISDPYMVIVCPSYGECYHRSNCFYLNQCRSTQQMTIESAIESGYRQCSRCKPTGYSSFHWKETRYFASCYYLLSEYPFASGGQKGRHVTKEQLDKYMSNGLSRCSE